MNTNKTAATATSPVVPAAGLDLATVAIAAGTTAGRVHRRLSRPNQDAFATVRGARGAVLAVCDGCGSAPRSEVGAALGARLWTAAVAARLDAGAEVGPALFADAGADVLDRLAGLAAAMGGDPARAVLDHFLFTSLIAVVTRDTVAVHAIGDGVIVLGDEVHELGPFADNQPPYLAQSLIGPRPAATTWLADPATVDRVVLASDGAGALRGSAAGSGPVPSLDELTRAAPVFANPAALSRRLGLLAEDASEIDWDARRVVRRPALLDDDTTIVVARWTATPAAAIGFPPAIADDDPPGGRP